MTLPITILIGLSLISSTLAGYFYGKLKSTYHEACQLAYRQGREAERQRQAQKNRRMIDEY